jgi:hypothetical protein
LRRKATSPVARAVEHRYEIKRLRNSLGIALELRQKDCEVQFSYQCKLQPRARSQCEGAHLLTIFALACLVRDATAMWDLIFILATVAFFIVGLAYVEGCQRL